MKSNHDNRSYNVSPSSLRPVEKCLENFKFGKNTLKESKESDVFNSS